MSDDAWAWELSSTAQDDIGSLDPAEQDQILDKLDEIIDSPWRDPPDYGEPLRNSPYKKIRIGEFRLSVTFQPETSGSLSHESNVVAVRTLPMINRST